MIINRFSIISETSQKRAFLEIGDLGQDSAPLPCGLPPIFKTKNGGRADGRVFEHFTLLLKNAGLSRHFQKQKWACPEIMDTRNVLME